MKSKYLMIPVAAFVLSAGGVSAFNPEVLEQAGLSETQISAFQEAHELKKEGDRDAARDVLADAGIDLDTLEEVRNALREDRAETKEAIKAAVAEEDYADFKEAAEGTPLEDKITSSTDFATFVEAQALREAGDREGARELLDELGIEKPEHRAGHGKHGGERGERGERAERN